MDLASWRAGSIRVQLRLAGMAAGLEEEAVVSNKPEDLWTAKEEAYLRSVWGWLPLHQIAENLGRTEKAVVIRVKRHLKLPSVKDWPEVYTDGELYRALGVNRKTVWELMTKEKLPVLRLWKRNTPVMAVDKSELKAWLANPENWYVVDVDKIQDNELRAVVRKARRKWGDRWLTIGQAARTINVVTSTLNKHCNAGRLPGQQHGNWYVKRSDLLKFARDHYGIGAS